MAPSSQAPSTAEGGIAAVTSWRVAVLCGVLAAASLAFFHLAESQIIAAAVHAGYTGDTAHLAIFDTRFGYTPVEAHQALSAWGEAGRHWYVSIELVDMLVYFAGYGGLFLVLLNRLGAYLARSYHSTAPMHAWVLIMVLVGMDVTEDVCQLLMVAAFLKGPPSDPSSSSWTALVARASCANQAKWWVLRISMTLLAVMLLAAAAAGLRTAAGQVAPAHQQQQRQQRRQPGKGMRGKSA